MCACFSHHRCKRHIHPQLSSMETLDLDCSRLFKINFAIDFCTNRSVVFVPSTVSSADCTEKMDAATVKPLTELWTNILKPQQHFGCPHVDLVRHKGIHCQNNTLLQHLFFFKWDHQWLNANNWDHQLIRKVFIEVVLKTLLFRAYSPWWGEDIEGKKKMFQCLDKSESV